MSLALILILTIGIILCAYAIYLEATKCKICGLKRGAHKFSCMYNRKSTKRYKAFLNHEVWVTCKQCFICFDAKEHGYNCPYCHTDNKH